MWNYNPKDAESSWPMAAYEATIEKVEETISKKSGDPMLNVHLTVYGPNGQTQTLHEYITTAPAGSGRKGSLFKLRAIASALGLYEEFKAGKLNPHKLVGQNVLVQLAQEYDVQYGDKNVITQYSKLERLSPVTAGAAAEQDDSDLPF